MNPEAAKAALVLLARTTLQGSEVGAFNVVVAWLESVANAPAPETHNPTKEKDMI